MTRIQGLWWPDDVGMKWRHALKHLRSLEASIGACVRHRTAVQAGGNIGLWPRRMAVSFTKVFTFEPDHLSRACLQENVPRNVVVSAQALGAMSGRCGLQRESLGSHHVVDGAEVPVTTVDALHLEDVDLLQLDVEGYEYQALAGAVDTVDRCHPVVHVELRNFGERYGQNDQSVRRLLTEWGYREHSQQPGNDVVFVWQGA